MGNFQDYYDKNPEQFKQLDTTIATGDIMTIYVAPEMFVLLGASEHSDLAERQKDMPDYEFDRFKYRGVLVIRDDYQAAGVVKFARKSDSIKFTMKCLCGIWEDEPHP